MDIESYIKDLDPELQERARACGSVEELLTLAKEEKVPVPDEALAAIAGGDDVDGDSCNPKKCSVCGHKNEPSWIELLANGDRRYHFVCSKCGHRWYYDQSHWT